MIHMAFATLGDQAELDFPNYQLLKHIYTRKTFAFGGISLALQVSGTFGIHLGNRRLRRW